jgi:(R,R)-butanediol dehydrogenase/meso-butanediol dehydrogenase/diacetyl reductase
MLAAVFQGRGRGHSIERVPDPQPAPGEVLIRVERSGICGSDISFTAPLKPNATAYPWIDARYSPGAVLGHEFGGEVVALGKGVERLKIGDRIAALPMIACGHCIRCAQGSPNKCATMTPQMGGFAQYAVASEALSARIDAAVPLAACALVEPMAACLRAVSLAEATAQSRAVVIGAGMIGLGIIYFLRLLGVEQIVAVARSEQRREPALRMGAGHFLRQSDRLPEEAAAVLGGEPDIVFDAAGGPGIAEQAVACVRPNGKVVMASLTMERDTFCHAFAAFKEVCIQYAIAYDKRQFEMAADHICRDFETIGRLAAKPVPLAEFPEQFESIRHRSDRCKVILDPWM